MAKLPSQNHFKYDASFKDKVQRILQYFVKGLLFVFPVGATIIILVALIGWIDGLVNNLFQNLFGFELPGLGIIIVFLGIALFGYLLSNAFFNAIFRILDKSIQKTPFVSLIYTSLKELTEAFVGDKKKFNKPVVVEMTESGMHRLGFITQEDLSALDIEGLVAIYCPHSYNFSGNLFLIPRDKVTPLDANPTDIMKFIVSAGVTNIRSEVKSGKQESKSPESTTGET